MSVGIATTLNLPCGVILSNRLVKPALTEGLAGPMGWVTPELNRLYKGWSRAGFGLMITGNIIVDGDHLERAGNVVIDREPSADHMALLKAWARSARSGGSHLWAQLSHSGRQTQKTVNPSPLSPSAVMVGLPGGLFGKPREMTEDDIHNVIGRFVAAARICQTAGFTGVQIHAAHGYLISSFLSPNSNVRTDKWGGSLENRARFLLEIVRSVRAETGAAFPISVKLNSADFQKGGFEAEESAQVALLLERAGVDLLEISGGRYEAPAMIGEAGGGKQLQPMARRTSTVAREAYFLDFARSLRQQTKMPILLTGGLRTHAGMQAALDEGADLLGVGRPVCVEQTCVADLLAGRIERLEAWEDRVHRDRGFFGSNSPVAMVRTLASFASIYWFYAQLYRLGRGEAPDLKLNPIKAMMEVMSTEKKILEQRRRWLADPVGSTREMDARALARRLSAV